MWLHKKKTFTLIEMLIVIVIIGILSAALIPRVQSMQWKARDAKRKTDLATLYNTIKIYYTDNNVYPQASNGHIWVCNYGFNCYAFSWHEGWPRIAALSWLLTSLPLDPINKAPNQVSWPGYAWPFYEGNYVYSYGNITRKSDVGRDYFDLRAQLESPQDPLRNEVQQYTFGYYNSPLRPGYAATLYAVTKNP